MFAFLAENWGSITVLLLVVAAAALAVAKMRSNRKKGGTSCGCGCKGCPSAAVCHKDGEPKDNIK